MIPYDDRANKIQQEIEILKKSLFDKFDIELSYVKPFYYNDFSIRASAACSKKKEIRDLKRERFSNLYKKYRKVFGNNDCAKYFIGDIKKEIKKFEREILETCGVIVVSDVVFYWSDVFITIYSDPNEIIKWRINL